jgi:hypothetical protein
MKPPKKEGRPKPTPGCSAEEEEEEEEDNKVKHVICLKYSKNIFKSSIFNPPGPPLPPFKYLQVGRTKKMAHYFRLCNIQSNSKQSKHLLCSDATCTDR